MNRSTFKTIYNKAKQKNTPIHLFLNGIESHGCYSSSSVEIVVKPNSISMREEFIIVTDLHTKKENSYDKIEHHSKLNVHVGESKLNTAWIEYDQILYGGIE